MKNKIYTLYIYSVIILFFVGCRGCSCNMPRTYILDTHIEPVVLNSGDSAKIRIEMLEKTGIGFTFKFKQHNTNSTHSVSYDLQINDRPYREYVYEHEAEGTDSLKQHSKDLTVEMSPDQLHLLVKYQKEIVGVYHLLPEGMPFTTAENMKDVQRLAGEFAQNKLGKPEDIMLQYIQAVYAKDRPENHNDKFITETLTQQGFTSLDMALLNYVGIPLVDSFYNASRIALLSTKNLDWRKKAIEKVNKSISTAVTTKKPVSREILLAAKGAVHLYKNGLHEGMEKYSVETLVLQEYPLYDYTISLYEIDPHRSLRKTIAQKVRKNCKSILSDANLRQTLPHLDQSIDAAIHFLVNYRDEKNTTEFDEIMASIFQKDIAKIKPKNLNDEILFPFDTRFSEAEQKIILAHAQRLKNELPKDANYSELEFFFKKIDLKNTTSTAG